MGQVAKCNNSNQGSILLLPQSCTIAVPGLSTCAHLYWLANAANASCRLLPTLQAAGLSWVRCCCACLRFLDSSTMSCKAYGTKQDGMQPYGINEEWMDGHARRWKATPSLSAATHTSCGREGGGAARHE